MFKVRTLNNIAVAGLRRFPRARYEVASEIAHPDAILVRSADMHHMEIPDSVVAVGRAGAGVNNIPIQALGERGVPVFNAPGANANAVKELVIAGLLVAARNVCDARDYVHRLEGEGSELAKAVEAGKKKFVGFELPSRTLGVIGLGAIGVEVANAALALGMNVMGFDPDITVRRAWQLSAAVQQADTLDQLFKRCDAVTLHVPLVESTHHLVNRDRLALMPENAVLINFARGAVVDNAAVLAALDSERLHAYVCDFPAPELLRHPKVTALPHLGASTREAEENCAIMVADTVRDYLENGNIRNSVNLPEASMPRTDTHRVTIANANVPNMVGQISTCLGQVNLNIEDLLNRSLGEAAYTIVDLDGPVPEPTLAALRGIKGVIALRNLGRPIS